LSHRDHIVAAKLTAGRGDFVAKGNIEFAHCLLHRTVRLGPTAERSSSSLFFLSKHPVKK
jgi:hypothetical protein